MSTTVQGITVSNLATVVGVNDGPILAGKDHVVIWWMVVVHIVALGALPFFTWKVFAVAMLINFLTNCLGITLGYHRLLSHRALRVPQWLERVLATLGTLSLQGGPLEWVAHHRMHHSATDTAKDPHNARYGFWWAHMKWIFFHIPEFDDPAIHRRFARDIAKDPYMRLLNTTWFMVTLQVALGLPILFLAGPVMCAWAIAVRMVACYHITWFINSACHFYGYRRYETDDLSRNCWWAAILAWGEGWHNNHHAYPSLAPNGHSFWEIDITYYIIRALEFVGLATDVKRLDASPVRSARSDVSVAS